MTFDQEKEESKVTYSLKQLGIQEYNLTFSDKSDTILVDVYEDVDLSHKNLSDFPVKFRYIIGNFDCSDNKLTSLKNAPEWIRGDFDCSNNRLVSLGIESLYVEGNLYCFNNPLLASLATNSQMNNIEGVSSLHPNLSPSEFVETYNLVIFGEIRCKHPKNLYIENHNEIYNAHKKFLLSKIISQNKIPRYLYKYYQLNKLPFQTPEELINTYTKRTLTDNELYFSSPSDFNDPYDCNSPIDYNSSEEEIEHYAYILGLREIFIPKLKELIKNDPNFIEKMARKVINENGICCFSKSFDSILMWSHYANYHKGICLKFDITKDPDLFLSPCVVKYSKILPHFDFFEQNLQQITELIRTKFTDWSYENEVRFFKTKREIQNNKQNNPRVFKFQNEALVEVIFGTKTNQENMKIVRKLCEKSGKNDVQFYQMYLGKDNCYRLHKKPL